MNVLLAYYNLLDDWEDEKNYAAFTAAKALKKSVTRIEASYPRQTKAVQDYLEKLHACEKENNPDLDLAAGYTHIGGIKIVKNIVSFQIKSPLLEILFLISLHFSTKSGKSKVQK